MNVSPGSAPLPDNDLAAMLAPALMGGGGAPPADPPMGMGDPMGGMPAMGPDPMGGMPGMPMGGPEGAGPMGGLDPMMLGAMGGPAGAGPAMFPTADPMVMAGELAKILEAQGADQAALKEAQAAALIDNPLFAALLGQAPMPGAGAAGVALGSDGPAPLPETMPGEPLA